MAQSREIQSLIDVTRQNAIAEERHAAELAEKNRLERERLDLEQRRTNQIDELIRIISSCQPNHHEPTMVILMQIKQDAATLLELSKVTAMRVVGEKDWDKIETILKNASRSETVRMDIGSSRIEFDDVRGDVNAGNLAGRDTKR